MAHSNGSTGPFHPVAVGGGHRPVATAKQDATHRDNGRYGTAIMLTLLNLHPVLSLPHPQNHYPRAVAKCKIRLNYSPRASSGGFAAGCCNRPPTTIRGGVLRHWYIASNWSTQTDSIVRCTGECSGQLSTVASIHAWNRRPVTSPELRTTTTAGQTRWILSTTMHSEVLTIHNITPSQSEHRCPYRHVKIPCH